MVRSLTRRGMLDGVAALGRPFVITADPGGRPLYDLAADPTLLRARVVAARDELGSAEDRVAASWVFTGLAARVVAPAVATVALHGWLPDPAALRWHAWAAGVVPPLSSPAAAGADAGPEELASALVQLLGGLVAAVRARTRVAVGLLWGEVAASAVKAGRVVERERPGAATPVVAALLAREPLAPTVHPLSSARRTCCLAYRVPGGRTCADCPVPAVGAGRSCHPSQEVGNS